MSKVEARRTRTTRDTLGPAGRPRSPDGSETNHATPAAPPDPARVRLRSLDAIRGLAIVVMLLNANPFPRQHQWTQLQHPAWHGLTFADLFFPLFLFAMGAAMTMSKRASEAGMVLRRVVLLYALGVGLTSLKHQHLGVFGVLQHIAIAYLLAWLILKAPRKAQVMATVALLAASWLAFVSWAGDAADPWGRSGTFAHAVSEAITGGFSTEALVQSVVSTFNVVAGAIVARNMRGRDPRALIPWLGRHMAWLFVAAAVLAFFIPVNKRLWTPSFAVLSTATSCLWLALFVWIADLKRWRLSRPLERLGANPIAVYIVFMVATYLLASPVRAVFSPFEIFGNPTVGQFVYGLLWVCLGLLFAHWLYRRRIFIKI